MCHAPPSLQSFSLSALSVLYSSKDQPLPSQPAFAVVCNFRPIIDTVTSIPFSSDLLLSFLTISFQILNMSKRAVHNSLSSAFPLFTQVNNLILFIFYIIPMFVEVKTSYTALWWLAYSRTPVSYTHLDVYKRQNS